MAEDDDETITSIDEVVEAVYACIQTSNPTKRDHLAKTINAYREDFSEDYRWATGGQSPYILSELMRRISVASEPLRRPRP
jgi:hypothetical protein